MHSDCTNVAKGEHNSTILEQGSCLFLMENIFHNIFNFSDFLFFKFPLYNFFFFKRSPRGVCGPLLTYGHAVVVQLIPAALLTHSQTLLIQHVQQTDRTHLFFLILHTAKMDTPTPSSALPHWPFLTRNCHFETGSHNGGRDLA